MFNFLKKAGFLFDELKRAVTDLRDATYELKYRSLPRRLNDMSDQIKSINNSIDKIYILFKRYIESKEISEINKLRIENEALRDCILMEKEQQKGKKSKTAEESKQPERSYQL